MRLPGIWGERKDNGHCPMCDKPVDQTLFKFDIDRREFEISGLCMACQNEIFCDEETDNV